MTIVFSSSEECVFSRTVFSIFVLRNSTTATENDHLGFNFLESRLSFSAVCICNLVSVIFWGAVVKGRGRRERDNQFLPCHN